MAGEFCFDRSVSEDRRATEWIELKTLERDFFRELRFVSEQARKLKRDAAGYWLCIGLMGLAMLVPLLVVAISDLSRITGWHVR